MLKLEEYSGNIIEITPSYQIKNEKEYFNIGTLTDSLPDLKNNETQTNLMNSIATQTDFTKQKESKSIKNLEKSLKNIDSIMMKQLKEGITPSYEPVLLSQINKTEDNISIKPYQSITFDSFNPNLQYKAVCTWLSVKANTAPILVIGATIIDNNTIDGGKNNSDCSETIIKIYNPNIQQQNLIVFTEIKSITIKSIINHLETNSFNKEVFSAGTVSGDIYIWSYSNSISTQNICVENVYESTDFGSIMSIGWLSINEFLSCHENCIIIHWKFNKNALTKYQQFKISNPNKRHITQHLTAMVILSTVNFIVGTSTGNLFLCSLTNDNTRSEINLSNPFSMELKQHKFGVKTLIKSSSNTEELILSSDLSGEVYFHDITFTEDGPQLIYRLNLPFKNSFTALKNSKFLLFPGQDGSFDILSVNSGNLVSKFVNERGKGNFTKISDNGFWLATGIFCGMVQIHKIDD